MSPDLTQRSPSAVFGDRGVCVLGELRTSKDGSIRNGSELAASFVGRLLSRLLGAILPPATRVAWLRFAKHEASGELPHGRSRAPTCIGFFSQSLWVQYPSFGMAARSGNWSAPWSHRSTTNSFWSITVVSGFRRAFAAGRNAHLPPACGRFPGPWPHNGLHMAVEWLHTARTPQGP